MFDYLQFDGNQKVDLSDFTRIAQLPRDSFDRYMSDVIGSGSWYSGFACTDKGSGQLNVGNGEIYINGVGYYNDTTGGEVVNLLALAPTVSFRWVAILFRGLEEDEDTEPTTYLTDSTTRATTGKYKPRLKTRAAVIDTYSGAVSADPQIPTPGEIPAGNVVVAYVKISPAGIVTITPAVLNMLPTLLEARTRLNSLDSSVAQTNTSVGALTSNIAAIQDRLAGVPQGNFVLQLASDVGALKEALKVPQVYTSYGTDHFLDEQYSDTTNPDYLAQVNEGIRFPFAAESDSQLGLLNPYDGTVTTVANMVFPNFTPVIGLTNTSHDQTVILSQYQYQTLNIEQLEMTRTSVSVGPWFAACTNWFWYVMGGGAYDPNNHVFHLFDGDNYEIAPEDYGIADGIGSLATSGHYPIRIRQVWYDTEQVPYSLVNTVSTTIQGATHGNTFLCPRDGWMPTINLYFADKAQTGDVQVILMQVPSNGQPDMTKVIGTASLAVGDIKISTAASPVPTPVNFTPLVALQKGQRYALATISSGAHTMWCSSNNKLMNGSYFVNTDGAWNQGDLTKDLCFDIIFAEFTTPQLAVQLNPLSLAGGINAITVLAQMYVPSGTALSFQVQVGGVWTDILSFDGDTSPLVGLPPLLPFRALFTGTTDLMPGLGVASNSRVTCTRPRSDFKHITDQKLLPANTTANTVSVTTRLEWWRGAPHHTHGVKLRTGANYQTLSNPALVKDTPAPDDPDNAIIRVSTFSFAQPISTFQIEQDGTTDNVVQTFHVAELDYVALTQ